MTGKGRSGLSDIFNLLLGTRGENKIIWLIIELTEFKLWQNIPGLQDWTDMSKLKLRNKHNLCRVVCFLSVSLWYTNAHSYALYLTVSLFATEYTGHSRREDHKFNTLGINYQKDKK